MYVGTYLSSTRVPYSTSYLCQHRMYVLPQHTICTYALPPASPSVFEILFTTYSFLALAKFLVSLSHVGCLRGVWVRTCLTAGLRGTHGYGKLVFPSRYLRALVYLLVMQYTDMEVKAGFGWDIKWYPLNTGRNYVCSVVQV
jgi:hypothetical protein